MSFLGALRLWHDFFVGMGVASAALAGFVFLGLTQRNGHANGHGDISVLEGQTLGSLFGVLIVSLLILIPEQTPRSLGFTLLAASILGLGYLARALWHETRFRLKNASPSFFVWRLALPLAVLVATTLASIIMLGGARSSGMESLYWLSSALLALLVIAARNTWTLLGHSGQERLRLHRGNRG